MSSSDLPNSIAGNIADWTRTNAEYTDPGARRAWARDEVTWGVFGVREEDIGSPLGAVSGVDIVELGSYLGTLSMELFRVGPDGACHADSLLDPMAAYPAGKPYAAPAFSRVGNQPFGVGRLRARLEYGASLWADPKLWIAEAARLLRPRGRLVFLTNSVLAYLCFPEEPGYADERLHRPQAGMYVKQWPGEEGTEYHLAHGDWINLLHANDFELEDLIEVYAPPGAEDHGYYETVTVEWAQKWPGEELWVARKR